MKLKPKKSFNNWIKVGEDNEEFLIDYPSVEQEQYLQSIQFSDKYSGSDIGLKYAQYYLKFVIKDWKNVYDTGDEEVKCKIINNELENDIWWRLVSNESMVIELFTVCYKELEVTVNDKKK